MQGADRTVRVTIKYFAQVKAVTGGTEDRVDFPGAASLVQAVDWLAETYGLRMDGQVLGVLNGQGWNQLTDGLDTRLESGDVILLVPPIDGDSA